MYGNRLIFRIRYWIAKLIYDFIFFVLVRDGSWEEGLLASLAPKPGDRILDFGPGSASTAVSLAERFPEATFVGMDPNPRSTKKARLAVSRRELRNVSFVEGPLREHSRLMQSHSTRPSASWGCMIVIRKKKL